MYWIIVFYLIIGLYILFKNDKDDDDHGLNNFNLN